MSFGEPIALRMQAEIEAAADTATSAEARAGLSSAEVRFIDKLKEGDPAAFDRLVEERTSEIFALLYRLTDDREEARDLTQETFLLAFRNVAQFRGDADLRTWLYRIAVNQARNRWRWWRRRRRERTVSLDEPAGSSDDSPSLGSRLPDDGAEDPERTVLARERERILLTALGSLSRNYREVVVLRDIEGLSYEEVASTLEISVGTVKSRLSRGRLELRRRVEGYF